MIKIKDTAKLATRMFRTKPVRTWLTILGMGVGIAAVVALVGLGFGLQKILLEQIVFGDAMLSLEVISQPSLPINDKKIEEFLNIKNVTNISPLASFNSSITFNNLTGSINLRGVEPEYFKYAGISIDKGKFFTKETKNDIVLSSAVLKLFNIDFDDAVGKKIKFKVFIKNNPNSSKLKEIDLREEYTIAGVVDDTTSLFAYVSMNSLKSQFAINTYERVRAKVTNKDVLVLVKNNFIDKGFLVNSLSDTVEQANKIFVGIQVVLAIFGGIALIVSAIGMFNTMTVTLLERTKEIGIMRTIGASNMVIMILFLSEAFIMGFFGGLMGILIGVGSGTIVNFVLNIFAAKMGGQSVSLFQFPLYFLLIIGTFSAIMGLATGYFPARRASKLNPLDAIRQ